MKTCDNPHQELTMQELTDRFYLVRRQRDQLIACIQKVQRITWDTERGSEEKSHDILKACEEASNFVLFSKHQAPDVVQGEEVTVDWIQNRYAGQAFGDEFAFSDHFHRWQSGELWQGKYVRIPAKTRQQFCDLCRALGIQRKDGK